MKRVLLIITLSVFTLTVSFTQTPPKREFRGAWLHIVGNQEMKNMTASQIKEWFTKTLDALEKAGCNAVIFQIRPQADAFYQSEIEPWTRFLTGEQGKAPDTLWDPLNFMIKECHHRGMELHAWLNPYRVTSNDEEWLSPEHLYFKKPEIFKRYGKQLYFNPGEPESRKHTVKVISDIVRRYDIDGIHFDDYFYPYPEKYEEFHDDDSFVKYAKQEGFDYRQKNDWRRFNVASLIKEVNDTIKSIKPWVRFGISPFGIHRNLKETPDGSGSNTNGLSNYEALFADVPDWAQKGYIDYIVPQLYWKIGHPVADYETLINWWSKGNFNGHLYIGQNISSFGEKDLKNPKTTQMRRKMELSRNLPNIKGNIWWPGWLIYENNLSICDSLTKNYQRNPALIPAYTNIDNIPPPPVKDLKISGKTLTWQSEISGDKMQNAHFFIIYRFLKQEKTDINNSNKIVKISAEPQYMPNLPKKGKYKYIVTVVDRCWNESVQSTPIFW